jgi:hypothetical protein
MIRPIKNGRLTNKARGGIWTSPLNSSHSWKNWCNGTNWRNYPEDLNFKLRFNKDSKILLINNIEDLNDLPLVKELEFIGAIDFESLSKECDAIWLTEKGLRETEDIWPVSLMGWDCETVHIFNSKCCYQIN